MKNFMQIILSVLLFIPSYFFLIGSEDIFYKVVYVGIIMPALLQRIWFGISSLMELTKKAILHNLIFSVIFIVSALVITELYIGMVEFIRASEEQYASTISYVMWLSLSRILFLFAMLVLWNYKVLQHSKHFRILKVYKFIQYTYTLIFIPVVGYCLFIWSIGFFIEVVL